MRRPLPLVGVSLVAAGLFAAGLGLAASGTTATKLSAKLSARSEPARPKGAGAGSGLFTATLSGTSLTWRLTFSRLTGKALAAHVHIGMPGVSGPVAVPLCGPCVSGAHGTKKLTGAVRAALLSGRAYVNVHTARNPAGEIRGQVTGGRPLSTGSTTTETEPTTTGYGGY